MTNFSFLKAKTEYALFAPACMEAEKIYVSAPAMCAVGCRKALELAVKWVYAADKSMKMPYKDNLQSLIHEPTFRFAVDSDTWGKMPFIIKLGNLAVHTERSVQPSDALASLRGLFEFVQWIDYCYGADYQERTFDENLVPTGKVAVDTRKIKEQESLLDQKDAEIEALRKPYANDPEFQKYEAYRDDGIDLARLQYNEMRRLRSDMQLIFQDPYSSLNPRMSVGQIVSEGMQAHNMIKKKDARMQEMVLKIMDDCGLAPYFLHRFPHQFSGGQRQRIGIARALATKPKFVVCDEAVSALDVSIQAQIINLLLDLKEQQNLTYMFITHDLSVVKYISDRVGVMYLGTMVELAAADEIFHHPIHPYTEALLNAIPTTDTVGAKELSILEGDIPSPVNPPKGCKFHTRCKYCTEICTQVVPEWEEVRPNHFVACHHKLEVKE